LDKDVAEGWYLTLREKHSRGELKNEKTISFAREQFLKEFEADAMG